MRRRAARGPLAQAHDLRLRRTDRAGGGVRGTRRRAAALRTARARRHVSTHALGKCRVPAAQSRLRAGGKGGAFGSPRAEGREGSPTVAAEGRRYGSHAGPNAAGRWAREPRALRGGLGRGRVSGRAPQPSRRGHHAAALLLESRVPGGPAGPASRTAGPPPRRRGEGTR